MRSNTLATLLLIAIAGTPALTHAQTTPDSVRFVNPPTLSTPHGYSQLVEVPAGSRMVFIAGQVPLDSTGRLVGAGDFRAQAVQVFENLQRALAAAGATWRDVVKLEFYVLDASQLPALRQVRDRYINGAAPPASVLVEVRRLFRDDVMLEVAATVVVRR